MPTTGLDGDIAESDPDQVGDGPVADDRAGGTGRSDSIPH
jgi:hypothetical protein